jgi:hypothetical protein
MQPSAMTIMLEQSGHAGAWPMLAMDDFFGMPGFDPVTLPKEDFS